MDANQYRPSLDEPVLTRWQLMVYGLPYLSYAVVFQPLALYVPAYYADDLGLPLAGVGLAIAASRALDLFTDPVIGALGDRTRTRWGRRKPWILLGALPMLLATWKVFCPPHNAGLGYLLAWTCVLFLAFTIVDLPYKAWGAELSTYYHQRSRITAWREALGFTGQLLAVLVLLTSQMFGYVSAQEQLSTIAMTVVFSMPPLLALALYLVPEKPPEELQGSSLHGWNAATVMLRNPAFLRIISTVVLFCTGLTMQSTLHRIVFGHIAHAPNLFLVMLLLENLGTIAVVPLWQRLAIHTSKHRALSMAALWVGMLSLLLPLAVSWDSSVWPFVVLLALRGAPFAAILFLANSIAADIVDFDTVASGRQRTGLFFAVWTMMTKLSVALGILLATAIPAVFGIEPAHLSAINGPDKWIVLATYAWLPGLLMIASASCLWNFPITQARQVELREQIRARAELG